MTSTPVSDAPPAAPPGRRRLVFVTLVVVLAAGIAGIWLWPSIRWSMWIHGAEKKEYYDDLVNERDERVVDKIASAMSDESLGFALRARLASILIKKDRLPLVEKALKDGDLGTRSAALTALNADHYFPQYVDDLQYRVRETLIDWVSREGDDSRASALAMLNYPAAKSPEVLPLVRAILAAPMGSEGHPSSDPHLRIAAVATLGAYQDCDGVEVLVALVKGDEDSEVRLRALQTIESLVAAERAPPCASRLPATDVRDLAAQALSHPGDSSAQRALRMGALQILARHPDWAKERLDAIRARLGPEVNEIERRTALQALLATKDGRVLEEFPRWFHDPSSLVRSQAAQMAAWKMPPYDDPRFRSCLVGLVRDETDPGSLDASFIHALSRLRELAGEWKGFPERRVHASGALEEKLRAFVKALYLKGEAEGVTRDHVADAWFRWLAEQSGRDEAGVAAAVRVRDAFWAKAKAGDAKGAKAALEDPDGPATSKDLFTYEQGWLLAHGS